MSGFWSRLCCLQSQHLWSSAQVSAVLALARGRRMGPPRVVRPSKEETPTLVNRTSPKCSFQGRHWKGRIWGRHPFTSARHSFSSIPELCNCSQFPIASSLWGITLQGTLVSCGCHGTLLFGILMWYETVCMGHFSRIQRHSELRFTESLFGFLN